VKHFSKLKAEVRKHWRHVYVQEMQRRGEPVPADFQEQEPDDGELFPPDAARVARRACCLAAVGLRGIASNWSHEDQQKMVADLARWFAQAGLEDEIESKEREVLFAPASELDQKGSVNASWRWEGAAVLAASLGAIELPPHDQPIELKSCGDACGLFQRREQLDQRFAAAAFDPNFDRFAYADRAIAVHWRLRQFINGEAKPMDFTTFAKGVEWATFDLRGVKLIDGDLAIGGAPIARATRDDVFRAMSIASERHIAANWLIGWDPIYSDVENPT
jgi:Domain of unknown function (DUF4272)